MASSSTSSVPPSMASYSTSSVPKSFKYDVFLSFRGEDTRKKFIAHLYHALQDKNIYTYKDDEKMKKGEGIKGELSGAIEESRFYIIVFSKNYASSFWCLNELVKIMECQKEAEHTAYPLFYDVEPTEVRHQTGEFGKVFAGHENEESAGKWRKALTKAAGLAGWELKNTANGDEANFIKKIVEELSLGLRFINFFIDEKLVGMETRINHLVTPLRTASGDVHMIGIWGIGGGGKTTLARAVFNKISFQFEGKSFIENVKDRVKTSSLKLQKQVLSDVLDDQGINVGSENEGKNMMSRMMRGRKVLLVLDDVDHINQLQALAGNPNWFMPGSMIIITTREQQVLVAHGVKYHNVNLLTNEESICLFTRYAFGREITKGYEELSRQVVRYAVGLPLTLKVLGSSLCGKSKPEWEDALARLEKIPEKEIQEQLEVSFTGLDDEQKEMFLDVATILKGWPKDSAIKALESCGLHAVIGLRNLEQKSLITFYYDNYGFEFVGMHEQLQEMGRNIVRRTHPDMPHKRSRLWDSKEIEDVLAKDQGTEATRCINFRYEGENLEIIMQGLRKMKELRFLMCTTIKYSHLNRDIDKLIPNFLKALAVPCCNWKFNEASPYFPDSLRYLFWVGYPFRSLPKGFQGNNLVGIFMGSMDMVQLWEGGERKVLNKLRSLLLRAPKMRFLDLGVTPNLETLTFTAACGDGVEVYIPIECPKLISIHLHDIKLRSLDIRLTPNLEALNLSQCNDLQELHMGDEYVKLRYLYLSHVKLKTFNVGLTPNLERLCLGQCHDLQELHMGDGCVKLRDLHLWSSKIRTLDLGLSPNLEIVDIYACNDLEGIHISKCPILTYIRISDSKLRTLDLRPALNLSRLSLLECKGLVELQLPTNCINLMSLQITKSNLRTLVLGLSPILKLLELKSCYNLEKLYLHNCQELDILVINHLKLRSLDLGLTPNIRTLHIKGCYNLVELRAPIGCLKNLVYLDLCYSLMFDSFLFYLRKNNESLEGRSLAELYFTPKICPFHPDNHLRKFNSRCFYEDDLTSLRRSIEKLISEGPCACKKLMMFSRSIRSLQRHLED